MDSSDSASVRRRTVLNRVGTLAAFGAFAGCSQGGDSGDAGQDGSTVSMSNTAFSPLRLAVESGTTVTWENQDSVTHTVVAAQFHSSATDWSFESDQVQAGQSTTYTFESAGVYEYYCDVHGQSNMCGAVLVGDESLSESLPCESDGGGGMY